MRTPGENILIKANGISICYDDLGEGKLPVIFIHGFPFNKSMWKPQIEFMKLSMRVIAYDIRGFGKSDTGDEEFSMNLFADDLVKLMDALQISRAIVCGLSMGGYVLLNAINRYPERFAAIVLCCTQCIADTPEGKEKRFKAISMIEEKGLVEFEKGFIRNIFSDETLSGKREIVDSIKQDILSTSPRSVIDTLKALASRDESCSFVGKISAPTLILCGAADKVIPAAQSEFLHANIRESTIHFIDQAGHLPNLEQPGLFNIHLNAFVRRIMG